MSTDPNNTMPPQTKTLWLAIAGIIASLAVALTVWVNSFDVPVQPPPPPPPVIVTALTLTLVGDPTSGQPYFFRADVPTGTTSVTWTLDLNYAGTTTGIFDTLHDFSGQPVPPRLYSPGPHTLTCNAHTPNKDYSASLTWTEVAPVGSEPRRCSIEYNRLLVAL